MVIANHRRGPCLLYFCRPANRENFFIEGQRIKKRNCPAKGRTVGMSVRPANLDNFLRGIHDGSDIPRSNFRGKSNGVPTSDSHWGVEGTAFRFCA